MSAIAKTKQLVSIRSESRTIYAVATNSALEPLVTNLVLLDQLNKYPGLMEQETDAAEQFFLELKRTVCSTLLALGIQAPRPIRILKPSKFTPIGRHSVGLLWRAEAEGTSHVKARQYMYLILRYEPSRVIVEMMRWPETRSFKNAVSVEFEVGQIMAGQQSVSDQITDEDESHSL